MSAPVLSRLFIVQGKAASYRSHPVRACRCSVRNSPCGVKQPKNSWTIKKETLAPNPQSQSFSQSYGSILPTSLTYFTLLTRGCLPWGPDADMGTDGTQDNIFPRIFKDTQRHTGRLEDRGVLPRSKTLPPMKQIPGHTAVIKKRKPSPGTQHVYPS